MIKLSRTAILPLLTVLALAGNSAAQTVCVYENVLQNGFSDQSTCVRNLASTNYIYNGTKSIQTTFTAAGQKLSFAGRFSLPTTGLSSLTFEINGGAASGQKVKVSVISNGSTYGNLNVSDFLPNGIVKNTWSAVTIPLAYFGIPSGQNIDGLVWSNGGGVQPSFYLAEIDLPLIAPPRAGVAVAAPTFPPQFGTGKVDQKMFGVNVAVWDSGLTTTASKSLLTQAGLQTFRFPGGSTSDGYHWATNTQDSNTWTWGFSFDNFASIAKTTTGNSFITVNYGTGTAAEAAAWVAYNKSKAYGFKYWEVGNEVYGSWEEDHQNRAHDPVTYATRFAQYYTAMKAQDSTIKIGAVGVQTEDLYANYSDESATNPVTNVVHHGWMPVMLAKLKTLGVYPDFIIYHRYPESGLDCDYFLLSSTPNWQTEINGIRTQLTDYLGSSIASGIKIMVTESNSDSGPMGKQSTSMTNALYLADSFGSVLSTEAQSHVWWDFVNGSDTTGDMSPWLYGWRTFGDLGVSSTDFGTQYPAYYIQQLLSKFAAPGDAVGQAVASYPLLSIYTTYRASDNSVRVMIINKNPLQAASTTLEFEGWSPPNSFSLYQFGPRQDNASEYGANPGLFSLVYKTISVLQPMSFPAYSVTVLVFPSVSTAASTN